PVRSPRPRVAIAPAWTLPPPAAAGWPTTPRPGPTPPLGIPDARPPGAPPDESGLPTARASPIHILRRRADATTTARATRPAPPTPAARRPHSCAEDPRPLPDPAPSRTPDPPAATRRPATRPRRAPRVRCARPHAQAPGSAPRARPAWPG